MHEVDPRQILNNPDSTASDKAAAWQQLKKPELQQGITAEAKELLRSAGKHHIADISDTEFVAYITQHGIQTQSAAYDNLRDEWRNYRQPGESYLRAEFLAHEGDPTRWAELRYWLSRWCRHFKTWLSTPPTANGTPPPRSPAFRYADERLKELLRHAETLPWMRQSIEVYIAMVMHPDPALLKEYGVTVDLWRPDPVDPQKMISETELLFRLFPPGDEGGLALYRRMEHLKHLLVAGVWEYPGTESSMQLHFTKAKDKLAPRS